ncbi:LA_2272 family surface repeat-containing protein [Spirochaeta cellobiosiphila]|uniref:LA_2272 family surface repeat-containing protein n=1 Tax=Spirochaeta cellobiosiphila TaxID=504483 RepID=UPI000426ACCD|nr:hypothetical protein [Spirochaeta cellobiosiphila]
MKYTTLILALCLSLSSILYAEDNTSQQLSPFQITVAYPLATHGSESLHYTNMLSLNWFYGLNGGVKGLELGTLFNYNAQDVMGLQWAGITNINGGDSKGVILSGVTNIGYGRYTGLFLSGILNYSRKGLTGVAAAPVNINTSEVEGLQLGVFNYTKNLKGVQFGLVNYVENADKGLPIGLVNIVKDGYMGVENVSGEVIYTSLILKVGMERYYTSYKFGLTQNDHQILYVTGLGIGRNVTLSDTQKLSIDLSVNQIHESSTIHESLNLLHKLDLNYKRKIINNLSFLLGPSLNFYVYDEKLIRVPYSFGTWDLGDNKANMWIGMNTGIGYSF